MNANRDKVKNSKYFKTVKPYVCQNKTFLEGQSRVVTCETICKDFSGWWETCT